MSVPSKRFLLALRRAYPRSFAGLIGLPPFYHIFGWANIFMVAPSFSATVTIVSKVRCDPSSPPA